MKKALISLLMIIIFLFSCFNINIFAATPDLTKEISLTIAVKSGDKAVSGGALSLYCVAVLNDDMSYTRTNSFKDLDAELDIESASLTDELLAYIEDNKLTGTRRTVDINGISTFDTLEPGIYFVMQNISAEGYEEINPFVISLPMLLDGGEYDYGVEAVAKTEPESEDIQPSVTTPSVTTRPSGNLPQTGQLKWPIPILAVCGVGLIAIGIVVICNRKNGKNEE